MDAGSYTLPHCALQPSPSFFSPRSRNTITLASTSTTAPPPYVTHLSSLSPTSLLAVTSDGQVSVVDKNTLRRTDGFRHGKEGAFTNVAKLQTQAAGPSGTIWGVTDRDGKCSVFDARSGNRNGLDTKMEITSESKMRCAKLAFASFADPLITPLCRTTAPTSSPLLSLAFSSSSTPLLALGHELASIDAPIYTYDLRQTSAPVLTYDQSHSDDVTFLEFSSKNSTVADTEYLLSGSTDGLMTVYDLSKGSDEDEAVVSAANTGSSLARGGWGGAAPEITAQAGAPKPPSGDPDEQPGIYKGLGSAWAVSDMQTIGIWDAESVSVPRDSSNAGGIRRTDLDAACFVRTRRTLCCRRYQRYRPRPYCHRPQHGSLASGNRITSSTLRRSLQPRQVSTCLSVTSLGLLHC